MKKNLDVKTVSSLEKILQTRECNAKSLSKGSALLGEEYSYQVAFRAMDNFLNDSYLQMETESDISDCIEIYSIRFVPVVMATWPDPDENYITHQPAAIPDVLEPFEGYVLPSDRFYKALWINVKITEDVTPGVYDIKLMFKNNGEVCGESVFSLEVIGASLPKTDIPYTDWLHSDCIATYHNCEVFSEAHWELLDKYIKTAREHGINMILTPVFTPPLDTMEGAERPTVQLVDVTFSNGVYSFDFEKLGRWLKLLKKNNIEYVEVSQLYTQWGAKHTPKIEVTENGRKIKKFGWETDALGEEYKSFLTQLLPPLKDFLAENWDKDKVYFHLSDEPNREQIEHYGEIYKFIKPLLGDFKQIDAISDYELYEKGYIDTPVSATHSIDDFINNGVENLWAYYCCGHGNNNLSNRFIAMPSYRNRIMGMQLYKHRIKGFLHWGYNFYYSKLSTHPVNPYVVNDADGAFPAGDPFGVYPVKDGVIPSMRIKVFSHGLQDMMAAKLLESYIGREEVMKIVEKEGEIGFITYPLDSTHIIRLREEINQKIKDTI